LKLLEEMRQAGAIGAPLEARLSVGVVDSSKGLDFLPNYKGQLKDLFIVSDLQLFSAGDANQLKQGAESGQTSSTNGKFVRIAADLGLVLAGERAPGRKCQRCWMYFDDQSSSDLDPRCRDVLGVTA
jgi:hypothetical protein